MQTLTRPCRAFQRDERGAVAIIFAVSIVALLLLAGLAVDTARYQNLSARLQTTLDGATLAAAKLLSDEQATDAQVRERALSFFQAAIPTLGIKASAISEPSIIVDRTNSSVEVNAEVKVPTFFGRLAAMPSLTVINQKSKVVYEMQKVELALVLDITGSMNQKNKINDLKVAAKEVIDTLYDGALNEHTIRIAVAPYSASVNAGQLAGAVSVAPVTTTCTWSWSRGYYCRDVSGVDSDTCVIERTGANAATDAAPTGADKLQNMTSPSFGNYACPSSTIIPLMGKSQQNNLKSLIDGYTAMGSTAGHIGTAWGWYLLSPNWAGVLPADSQPEPYGKKDVQKVMVIMTDGEFNTSYIGGADPANPWMALSTGAQQITESYQQFDSLCANIKNEKITVYTVGFDLNVPDALAHLASCASAPENFYDVKTGAQLKDAFKDIANKLGNLRVAS